MRVLVDVLIIVGLALLNGIFAMSELALVAARKNRLRASSRKGSRGAARALKLAADPNVFLSTVQIGITLVGIVAGVYGGASLAQSLTYPLARVTGIEPDYSAPICYVLVILAITYLNLVLGELVPKRLALAYPEELAAALSTVLVLLGTALRPFVRLLNRSTDVVMRLVPAPVGAGTVSEDDIKGLVTEGTRLGAILRMEGAILQHAFQLDQRSAVSVMTPRVDVAWLNLSEPLDPQYSELQQTGHRTFPVAEDNLDSVRGVVGLHDLYQARFCGKDIHDAVRPALIIPSSIALLRVLERLQATASDFALLVDEHGGVDGVVTLHDIFEVLVGELREPDELPAVVERADGSLLVDPAVSVNDMFERLGLEYSPDPRGVFHSLGGFVFSTFGRVPKVGDAFEYQTYRFEVMDMDGSRIDKVLISRPAGEHKRTPS